MIRLSNQIIGIGRLSLLLRLIRILYKVIFYTFAHFDLGHHILGRQTYEMK